MYVSCTVHTPLFVSTLICINCISEFSNIKSQKLAFKKSALSLLSTKINSRTLLQSNCKLSSLLNVLDEPMFVGTGTKSVL